MPLHSERYLLVLIFLAGLGHFRYAIPLFGCGSSDDPSGGGASTAKAAASPIPSSSEVTGVAIVFSESMNASTITTENIKVTASQEILGQAAKDNFCDTIRYDGSSKTATCSGSFGSCTSLREFTVTLGQNLKTASGNSLSTSSQKFILADDGLSSSNAEWKCWSSGGNNPNHRTVSFDYTVNTGKLTAQYQTTAVADDEPNFEKRGLASKNLGVTMLVSNLDTANLDENDEKLGLRLIDFNSSPGGASLVIQYGGEGKVNLRPITFNPGAAADQGTSKTVPAGQIYLCVTRDGTSGKTFYSTDGKKYTEITLPKAPTFVTDETTVGVSFDSDRATGGWTPQIDKIFFNGSLASCPTDS